VPFLGTPRLGADGPGSVVTARARRARPHHRHDRPPYGATGRTRSGRQRAHQLRRER